MFRDEITNEVSEPYEKAIKVVVKKRLKEYFIHQGPEKIKVGEGFEAVKEIKVRAKNLHLVKEGK